MGEEQEATPKMISLKKLARQFDADRSTVRRWLDEAGVEAIAMGNGPRSAIRYRVTDVERWLKGRPAV